MKCLSTWLVSLGFASLLATQCCAQSTAFTYQGRLSNDGIATTGVFDVVFRVFAGPTGGAPLASHTNTAVAISNGIFTAISDWGMNGPALFGTGDRWLEISLRQAGTGPYVTLDPRQPITGVPHAFVAANVTGVVPNGSVAGEYGNAVAFNNQANSFSGSFTGNGGALTNLSLASIGPAGTLDTATSLIITQGLQHLTGGSGPTAIAAGHLNADGFADLAVANTASGTLTILTNTGSGGFVLAANIGVGPGPFRVNLADINRDGLLDAVCANTNTVVVVRRTGNGTFGPATFHTLPPTLTALAVGDVNGDGWPDLLGSSRITNAVFTFLNNGAGAFPASPSSVRAVSQNPGAIGLADVNGDSILDLVIAHGAQVTDSLVSIHLGLGTTFDAPIFLTTGNGSKTVALEDVTGDGKKEIIVGCHQSGARIDIFEHAGGATFRLRQSLPTTYVTSLAIGDFNGDSAADIAATDNGFFGYTGLRVMLNDGFGRFAQVLWETPFQYASATAGNATGDGRSELIAAGGSTPGVAAVYSFASLSKPGLTVRGSASFTQNVGIGTATPQQALHVNVTPGNGEGIMIESAIAGHAPALYLNHTGPGGRNFRLASFGDNANAGSFRIRDDSLGGGDRFVINSQGNVGIGVPDPLARLHVAGDILAGGNLSITPPGAVSFGAVTRQMLNLWGTGYGIGVQSGAMYFRSFTLNDGFNWFLGGGHSDNNGDPGGGTRIMSLGNSGLSVNEGIGIGTPPSGWNLDVVAGQADARFITTSAANGSVIELRNTAGSHVYLGAINFNNAADSVPGQIAYTAANSIIFRTAGSTRMTLDAAGNLFISGAFIPGSNRATKEDFQPVNAREVLEKVAALPLSTWKYKADDATRHIGPMAQDFYSAFGLGHDDKHIATVDADGVALAAIQGLNEKLEEQREENARLREELNKLKTLVRERLTK